MSLLQSMSQSILQFVVGSTTSQSGGVIITPVANVQSDSTIDDLDLNTIRSSLDDRCSMLMAHMIPSSLDLSDLLDLLQSKCLLSSILSLRVVCVSESIPSLDHVIADLSSLRFIRGRYSLLMLFRSSVSCRRFFDDLIAHEFSFIEPTYQLLLVPVSSVVALSDLARPLVSVDSLDIGSFPPGVIWRSLHRMSVPLLSYHKSCFPTQLSFLRSDADDFLTASSPPPPQLSQDAASDELCVVCLERLYPYFCTMETSRTFGVEDLDQEIDSAPQESRSGWLRWRQSLGSCLEVTSTSPAGTTSLAVVTALCNHSFHWSVFDPDFPNLSHTRRQVLHSAVVVFKLVSSVSITTASVRACPAIDRLVRRAVHWI